MAFWGFFKRAIVGGIALGLSGCGTDAEPQEPTSKVHEAVTGSNSFTWTTAAAPWGSVGIVRIAYNKCPLLCENGQPPAPRNGCQNPTRQCTAQTPVACSGTLIQRDLVLTAGHCFCDIDLPPAVEVTSITFQVPGRNRVYNGGLFAWKKDDCGGSYEDDASQDLAVFQLDESVGETEVNSQLLKPFLSGDVIEFFDNDYNGPFVAGYGGNSGPDFGRPLVVGKYDANFWIDDANWFTGVSTGDWWHFVPIGGAQAHPGDSGGPLAVFKNSEERWYQIGVMHGGQLSDFDGQSDRDLYSPTWNNGESNGRFIAGFLNDADDDGVNDDTDNCAPTDPRLPECEDHISRCTNPTQLDSDGDGLGDECDNCPDDENPQQLNKDGDLFGDVCDGCPHKFASRTDSDGDGVWNECDNCNGSNGYRTCSSDSVCGTGFCRENGRCSKQVDDGDGDGVGGICDRCDLVRDDNFANSNERAEERLETSELQDICDPVPIYVASPFEEEVLAGIFPNPDANERNLMNNVTFGATAQIGHDTTGLSAPVLARDLPRQTYPGRVGFRFCNCDVEGSGMLTQSACIQQRCSVDPAEYAVPDASAAWKRITVAATTAPAAPPLSADLPRGAELNRLYTSDATASDSLPRIGALEGLYWSFWKDLARNGRGGNVPSVTVDNIVQTNGLFWSHTLGEGFPSASPRDEDHGNELRDVYGLVHAPFYRKHNPIPPIDLLCALRCPGLDKRIWTIFPTPPDEPDKRTIDVLGKDLSRIWTGQDSIAIQRDGDFFDVTDVIDTSVRGELSRQNRQWATPTEATTDRIKLGAKTIFVSVESPWTGSVPIREFIAAPGGRIAMNPEQSASKSGPTSRTGARAVLSALERSVYLIGGSRILATGATVSTPEIWRHDLESGSWDRIGIQGKVSNAALEGVLGASYDSTSQQLYVLGRTTSITAFSTQHAVKLTRIDTHTGVGQTLATLPAIVTAPRASLAVTDDHHVVLALQKDASTIQLFELDPAPARPAFVGYAKLTGQLDEGLFAPDDLKIPLVSNGVPRIQTVTHATLKQMTGAGLLGDADLDGVPDALDDCPKTYNPTQQGCPDSSLAVLYASNQLTLADRVQTPQNALLVSAGTALTRVGVDARIGSLQSRGPVELRDRARATGAILSGGSVTLGNGAGADGGIKANAAVALDSLASFALTFPAAGPPIVLNPDQQQQASPGSYGAVHVYSRSTLTLTGGDYFFESLMLEPQAALILDSRAKPVRIYVKSSFVYRGQILDQLGGTPRLLVAYFGTSDGIVEAPFDGTIVAPKAKIVLSSVAHAGAFYANNIDVQAGATILHVPLAVTWTPNQAGQPTPPPPPLPSSLKGTLVKTTDWGGGYCMTIQAKNTATVPTKSWSIVLKTNQSTIYTSWNAAFSANSGTVTVTPTQTWNKVVPAGVTNDTVGFCATRTVIGSVATLQSASGVY
jgi:hypothetical protein